MKNIQTKTVLTLILKSIRTILEEEEDVEETVPMSDQAMIDMYDAPHVDSEDELIMAPNTDSEKYEPQSIGISNINEHEQFEGSDGGKMTYHECRRLFTKFGPDDVDDIDDIEDINDTDDDKAMDNDYINDIDDEDDDKAIDKDNKAILDTDDIEDIDDEEVMEIDEDEIVRDIYGIRIEEPVVKFVHNRIWNVDHDCIAYECTLVNGNKHWMDRQSINNDYLIQKMYEHNWMENEFQARKCRKHQRKDLKTIKLKPSQVRALKSYTNLRTM